MTHTGSNITFRINTKKGLVIIKQKETYEDNAGNKITETFPDEVSLGLEDEKLHEIIQAHALSWIRGDSIRDEAIE